MNDDEMEQENPEEIIKELEIRLKEIETLKTQLWDQGKFDPMMEAEYWDCQIVVKQMREGESADVAALQQHKHDGILAAQQQVYNAAKE